VSQFQFFIEQETHWGKEKWVTIIYFEMTQQETGSDYYFSVPQK
jgi:hypothetical protein